MNDWQVKARSDGTKLYLQLEPTGAEVAYAWTGPAGAHSATIEETVQTREYTTICQRKVCIYDADGVLLGEMNEEEWR